MSIVALAVTADVPAFEVAVPCEVFGLSRHLWREDWYDFRVCAPRGVSFGGWFRTATPYGLDELVDADTVIVPAAHSVDSDPPHDLVDAVRAAHQRGARVASICTGAFVLAAAGLLDGKRAATHWLHADRLARAYPAVTVDSGVLYVDEGDVLTSAGTAAGIDLCLHLVRKDYGAGVANELARRLVTSPHRAGGQAQYVSQPVPQKTDSLDPLLSWVLEHLDEPNAVEQMAAHANLSTRHLTRLFSEQVGETPHRWLSTQRVLRAQELLEATDHPIDQVAHEVGMSSSGVLRRRFVERVGVSPDTYRRTFRSL